MENTIDKDLFEAAISTILLDIRPIRQTVTESTISFLDKYLIPKSSIKTFDNGIVYLNEKSEYITSTVAV